MMVAFAFLANKVFDSFLKEADNMDPKKVINEESIKKDHKYILGKLKVDIFSKKLKRGSSKLTGLALTRNERKDLVNYKSK